VFQPTVPPPLYKQKQLMVIVAGLKLNEKKIE